MLIFCVLVVYGGRPRAAAAIAQRDAGGCVCVVL